MRDRQEQFIDCWLDHDRTRTKTTRIAAVCEELGYSATLARNLRRQMTLPEDLRVRVADRPTGPSSRSRWPTCSPTCTRSPRSSPSGRRADHQHRPPSRRRWRASASSCTRTVVEDEELYAVRIDEGAAVLDAHERDRTRPGAPHRRWTRSAAPRTRRREPTSSTRSWRASPTRRAPAGAKIDVDRVLRERADAGRYAWVYPPRRRLRRRGMGHRPRVPARRDRTSAMKDTKRPPARTRRCSAPRASATRTSAPPRSGLPPSAPRRANAVADGQNSNLGLGHDIARKRSTPRQQLDALRRVVAHLFCEHFTSIIAYGAGWSDRARQQPVGDSERFEPRSANAIIEAELERALQEPDPLRGILQIVSRFAAAFVLDRNGVTATTSLGSTRSHRGSRAPCRTGRRSTHRDLGPDAPDTSARGWPN